VPQIMALTASWEMMDDFWGAIAPRAPITMPMDEMLAKPQSAYVAITMDRSYRGQRTKRGSCVGITPEIGSIFWDNIQAVKQRGYYCKCATS
jgi:hypothetical protein